MRTSALFPSFAAVLFLTALFIPNLTQAQESPALGGERPDVIAQWMKQLKNADEALKKGEWKKAKRAMNSLLSEMCDRIESGENGARLLAMAALQRGLAEGGLGSERDAAWDWHIATNLYPAFATSDFSAYPQVGELFDQFREEDLRRASGKTKLPDTHQVHAAKAAEYTRPKQIRKGLPKYPIAKRFACLKEVNINKIVIDREGVPTFPKVLTEISQPIFTFATLDALRNWRFKPAMLDGQPVEVFHLLTTTFNLPRCTN